ncbi:DUF31 family protein [Candidatus Mycoplasma haematohominis]|uniref:DUF31 family protein n=1 Tax=Candidatus Mycoplasma haematohominis TaxID=1494318 RepID=UPI001C0A70AB|nr:DUF31 family protein [Candidatus Mycoplasma haemohominis]
MFTPATTLNVESEKAKEIIETLEDYTVLISTSCHRGTGWFLDFDIPNKGRYPTTWYVGTNSHVASKFLLGDKYKVGNPINSSSLDQKCYNNKKQTPIHLGRRWSYESFNNKPRNRDRLEDAAFWHAAQSKKEKKNYNLAKVSASSLNTNIKDNAPKFVSTEPKEANFFYQPRNFIKTSANRKGKDYTKDFTVIEVTFKDENEARIITNNLFGKYHSSSTKYRNPLNFFHSGFKSATSSELNNKAFFTVGYPTNGWSSHLPFSNYSSSKRRAGKLKSNFVSDSWKDWLKITWNKKDYWNWGYRHVLENSFSGAGASGSLVSDINGNVLGLYSAIDREGKNWGLIEPLRTVKTSTNNHPDLSPEHDLLSGSKDQTSSFKSEVIKNKRKTWMARKMGWIKIVSSKSKTSKKR